mmetsp:Transcript_40021/g.78207  ORF Transcript_40021/g.78207 Transcript_40021/m.78207 type:complete len:250 (-) Transcript_40021:27-776(-)
MSRSARTSFFSPGVQKTSAALTHSPPLIWTSPARFLRTSRVPAREKPAPSNFVASPLISTKMLTTTDVGPPGDSSLALFRAVYSFSNLAASWLDQPLNFRSAPPASFPGNQPDSEWAPVHSSSFLSRATQTSFTSFDSARLLLEARSAAADAFSTEARIEELERSGEKRATCTLPTVIPFPRGPSSSNSRSKRRRGAAGDRADTPFSWVIPAIRRALTREYGTAKASVLVRSRMVAVRRAVMTMAGRKW